MATDLTLFSLIVISYKYNSDLIKKRRLKPRQSETTPASVTQPRHIETTPAHRDNSGTSDKTPAQRDNSGIDERTPACCIVCVLYKNSGEFSACSMLGANFGVWSLKYFCEYGFYGFHFWCCSSSSSCSSQQHRSSSQQQQQQQQQQGRSCCSSSREGATPIILI